MILEIFWAILSILSTIPMLFYVLYMRYVAKSKPWNIKIESSYEPTVSIIIPTYNEATMIESKLDNIFESDYPKDKMELIVVDSASRDKTIDIVEKWIASHPGIKAKLITENKRRGMVKALNIGLKHAENAIIVKTDADCMWFKDSLRNAVKYMADSRVGSVAGLHQISAYKETTAVKAEKTYRAFYKWLRIGESKIHSTVLYEGELMLVRKKLLDEMNGFDEEIGADDVPTALRVTERGYRAITAQDAYFLELTPYTWKARFKQKVRRGRHVLQALWKYKYLNFRGYTLFEKLILPVETYIYMISPLFAIPLIGSSILIIAESFWLFCLASLLAIIFLAFPWFRELTVVHLTNVLVMLIAIVKELSIKQSVTWEKIDEIR